MSLSPVWKLVSGLRLGLKRLGRTLSYSDTFYLLTRFPVVVSPNLGNPVIVSKGERGGRVEFDIVLACVRESPRKIKSYFTAPGTFYLRSVHTRKSVEARVVRVEPHKVGQFSYLRSLALRNIFGPRDVFYTVTLSVPAVRIDPPRRFLLFDLMYVNPKRAVNTNYHSVCITRERDWSDFTFYQFSDLHVAKRNDEVFDLVATRKYKDVDFSLRIEDELKRADNRLFFDERLRRSMEFFAFLNRANNFNNNLRQMISYANREANQGRLDFIVFTGDLVDYLKIRILGGRVPEKRNNWQFLHHLLVGHGDEEGLEVPVFTVVGNHDFRLNSYRIWGYTRFNIASEFRAFRLTREEAKYYNPLILHNPLRANSKALVDYHRLFNAKLNFFLQLGKFHFLFYNSGSDAWIGEYSFRDIIGGDPDSNGLVNVQVRWLQRYLEKRVDEGDHVFTFLHSPPINVSSKYNLSELRADVRVALGKRPEIDDHRLDVATLGHNRQEFLSLALGYSTGKKVDLVLCGHVHKPAEYHVKSTGIVAANRLEDRYKVTLDYYSEKLEAVRDDPAKLEEFWKEHETLVLCAAALGPSNSRVLEGRDPAFRKVEVAGSRVVSVKTIPLRSTPYIFLSEPHNADLEVTWRREDKSGWQEFRGSVFVEISNAKNLKSSKILFEVEVGIRGRGMRDIEFQYTFTPGSPVQSPGAGPEIRRRDSRRGIHLVTIVQNTRDWRLEFLGRARHGGFFLSGLTRVTLLVRALGVVSTGENEYRIVGDELLVRKIGISY
ncbi:MAG: metallophosphoesterase family protein [Promethearchaeota archaeon]